MSRLTERDIARRLSEREGFEPPADLLEKIKSEIPPFITVGKAIPAADRFRKETNLPRRQRWLIAASITTVLGAGLLAFQLSREMPSLEEVASEAPREETLALPKPAAPPPPAASAPSPVLEQQEADAESAFPPPPPPPPPPAAKRRDTKEELRALGYLAESAQPVEVPQDLDVEYGVEGGVEGGVVGGVAGGVAGGIPGGIASDAPASAPPPPPPPPPPAPRAQRMKAEPEAEHPGVYAKSAGTNPFVETETDRLTTFGLDVDTGSYTAARRSLTEGVLPRPESVRVEEFVSFFDYGDAPPARGDFALKAEGAPSPYAPGSEYRLLRFNVKAREVEDRSGTPPAVARHAEAQVEFDPAVVESYRLLGSENRAAAGHGSREETVGAGHSVTALYEVKLRPGAPENGLVATLHLRYRSPETAAILETVKKLRRSDLAPSWEQASPALRLAGSVAEFAEILRQSPWAGGTGGLPEVLRQAQAAAKALPKSETTAEFLDLVRRAAAIGSSEER